MSVQSGCDLQAGWPRLRRPAGCPCQRNGLPAASAGTPAKPWPYSREDAGLRMLSITNMAKNEPPHPGADSLAPAGTATGSFTYEEQCRATLFGPPWWPAAWVSPSQRPNRQRDNGVTSLPSRHPVQPKKLARGLLGSRGSRSTFPQEWFTCSRNPRSVPACCWRWAVA